MFLSRTMDLLIPRRCLLCRERSEGNLCAGYNADLPRIASACDRCAIPLENPWPDSRRAGCDTLVCGACIRQPPPFDAALAALGYAFPVTVLVQRFKFNRSLACGEVLSARLLQVVRESSQEAWASKGLLVPVPLHPARQFTRVFNQAEVIARDLGAALGIPVVPRVLRRVRRTPAQSGLNASERSRNLKDAFEARPVEGKRVTLVDDVMTTGATLRECARALKQAGAEAVAVWVAARAA